MRVGGVERLIQSRRDNERQLGRFPGTLASLCLVTPSRQTSSRAFRRPPSASQSSAQCRRSHTRRARCSELPASPCMWTAVGARCSPDAAQCSRVIPQVSFCLRLKFLRQTAVRRGGTTGRWRITCDAVETTFRVCSRGGDALRWERCLARHHAFQSS